MIIKGNKNVKWQGESKSKPLRFSVGLLLVIAVVAIVFANKCSNQEKIPIFKGDTLKYHIQVNDDRQQMTQLEIHTPSKYNLQQLDTLTTFIRDKNWQSEHLVIAYRVIGDERVKAMSYATAMYWTPEFAKKLAKIKDLNGRPFQLEMNDLYDADSTNYFKNLKVQ